MTREEAARAFAEAKGWVARDFNGRIELSVAATKERCAYHPLADFDDATGAMPRLPFRCVPNVEAAPYEHAAFAFRIAEAVGPEWRLTLGDYNGAALRWQVGLSRTDSENIFRWASALSWAALLAGVAALAAPREGGKS